MVKSIGLMSGTSMDGIDAVIMETNGKEIINPIASLSLPYNNSFKLALRKEELAVRSAKCNIASAEIIQRSTELHAEIVNKILRENNLSAQDIEVIGYHGQALYHNPSEGITIQIGDGQLLSNLTGIKVINDFRSQDIANGGQGAPLAPIYHHALAINLSYFPVVVVNCGGIANVTIVESKDIIKGFDTGPGNVLLDRYIREKTNNLEFMDLNGKYGLNGAVDKMTLEKLTNSIKPYLEKSPPKSLDSGDLKLVKELYDLSIEDACATLANFTAKCIVYSLKGNIPDKWILAGGGWKNPAIVKYLKQYLALIKNQFEIKTADEIGWNSTYMEAEIFAYLAVRSLYKMPISVPAVTGAKTPSYGGSLFIPNN